MAEVALLQATIWGTEEVLQVQTSARQKLHILPKFRPAPLFDNGSNSRHLVGVPPSIRKAFSEAVKRHAQERPNAQPLTFSTFVRRGFKELKQRPSGRPSQRPEHTDKTLWAAFLRAVARITKDNPNAKTPSFDEWVIRSEKWRKCGQRGGMAAKNSMRQIVRWVVVVHRRDMVKDPSIEQEWHKKLFSDNELAKTHRIALRGVLKRLA